MPERESPFGEGNIRSILSEVERQKELIRSLEFHLYQVLLEGPLAAQSRDAIIVLLPKVFGEHKAGQVMFPIGREILLPDSPQGKSQGITRGLVELKDSLQNIETVEPNMPAFNRKS